MTRLPLLRAAVLAAAALFPATAFIGGCGSGQPGSQTLASNSPQRTATAAHQLHEKVQHPEVLAPPQLHDDEQAAPPPKVPESAVLKHQEVGQVQDDQQAGPQQEVPKSKYPEAVQQQLVAPPHVTEEAFCSASAERVRRHFAIEGVSSNRLRGWPAKITEAVRIFLACKNASWTPRAIEALRDEVRALRLMAQFASQVLAMSLLNHEQAIKCRSDLSVLAELEEMHSGLLKTEPVEMDKSEPKTCPRNAGELGDAAKELRRRRKCRLDQLALRSNGMFGELLPAASVETCDRLSELDIADVAHANKLIHKYQKVDTSPGDGLAGLIQFVEDGAAAQKISHTRTRLSRRGCRS